MTLIAKINSSIPHKNSANWSLAKWVSTDYLITFRSITFALFSERSSFLGAIKESGPAARQNHKQKMHLHILHHYLAQMEGLFNIAINSMDYNGPLDQSRAVPRDTADSRTSFEL